MSVRIQETLNMGSPGKSYTEALETDLVDAVSVIRYYAGWADKRFGQTIDTNHKKFAYTLRQPVGVLLEIT